jgi:hypothetical protein
MAQQPQPFIPALNLDRLTPLYDPLIRWTMREGVFKPRLVRYAGMMDGRAV